MKKILSLAFALLLICSLTVSAFAVGGSSYPRLIDDANVIADAQEAEVCRKLDTISESLGLDVCAVIIQSLNGSSAEAAADYIYESCDYGFTSAHDGLMLLVALDEGEWYVTAAGIGIDYLTYSWLDAIGSAILPYLKSGDFGTAVEAYADTVVEQLQSLEVTEGNDGSAAQEKGFNAGSKLGFSALIGVIAGAVTTGANKSKLKSVYHKNEARSYVRQGSFNLTRSREIFLYRTVNRRPRPKDNNSSRSGGGRPSVHVSAGGMSHSGGGGKF